MSSTEYPKNINYDNLLAGCTPIESDTSGESRSRRVLVVGDEKPVAKACSTVPRTAYEVDTATSGETALDLVDDGYDVVLVDRRTPETPGEGVLEAIHRRGVDCRVVAVTALTPGLGDIDLSWADYVVESARADTLEGVVERALALTEYSDRRRKLNSKKLDRNVLEVELDETTLEDSAEYRRLLADIERLETEVTALEDALNSEEIEQAL